MDNDTFLTLSSDDLNLYYQGTFLPIKGPGLEPQWVQVHGFGNASSKTIVAKINGANGKVINMDIEKIKWNFAFPAAGNYNFKNSVIVFYRNPMRCNQKAIHNHTAYFHNLMRPLCNLTKQIPNDFFAEHQFALSPMHLNELFPQTEKEEIPFGLSLEKIMKKQALARKVTDRISMSQGVISQHPSLWLKDRLIGQLDVKKQQVLPVHDLFVPELRIAFCALGFTVRQ